MDDEGDEDSSKDEEEDVYQPDSEPEEPGKNAKDVFEKSWRPQNIDVFS
jgi:hypothetical protein